MIRHTTSATVLVILVAAAAFGARPSVASADERVKKIAVFPLSTSDKELAIYSRPIAEALANGLRKALKVEVVVSASVESTPSGVDLVVIGSIHKDKKGIGLEARVRDPEKGVGVGAVSSSIRPLEKLEESANELVAELSPVAAAWRRSKSRDAVRLKGSLLEVPAKNREPPTGAPSQVRPALFLIPRAAGRAAGGSVRVEGPATQAAFAFADRLGARHVPGRGTGADAAVALATAARNKNGVYALALFIKDVEFSYRGVLSARGSAVIRLVDRSGAVLYQKTVETDTVVGSKGDRHSALIYAVAEQCLDIGLPGLKKALER